MVRKRPTWIIYRKEVREALRDRKTLVIMVLLPLILYPLLFLGLSVGTAVQKEKLAAEPLVIGVSKDVPQGLRDALAEVEGVSVHVVTKPGDAVMGRSEPRLNLAVVIEAEDAGALATDKQATVHVLYDGGSDRSRQGLLRIREALEKYADGVRDQRLTWLASMIAKHLPASGTPRLARLKLTPEFVLPLAVEAKNVAPPTRQGGWILGQLLPMLICLLMIGATFYPAVDLTAGEKERGTLQTLLTAPISPFSMVAGKFLTVVTLALLTGVVNLATKDILCRADATSVAVEVKVSSGAARKTHIGWTDPSDPSAGVTLRMSGPGNAYFAHMHPWRSEDPSATLAVRCCSADALHSLVYRQAWPRERMSAHQDVGQSKLLTEKPDLILKEFP